VNQFKTQFANLKREYQVVKKLKDQSEFEWNNKGSQLWKFHGYSRLDLAVINILSNWPACSENHQFSIDISIFSKNAMNWWTNCFLATIQKRSQVQSSTDSGWTWLWHGIKQHIDQFTQQHLPLLGHEADKGEALWIFPVHPWSPACSWFITGDVGSCALRGWLGNGGFSAHMEWWCWWWCGQIGRIVFDISRFSALFQFKLSKIDSDSWE